MRIAGIIAEYNPFHNGHAYHVRETRRRTGCDYVVAVMDGAFTQRGEPALLSKWTRVRMALRCGVDAVFELPALYAVRPAEIFARGGVAILDGLGVDALSFGCETEDLGLLRAIAQLRAEEPPALTEALRQRLDRGETHARAWGEAAAEYLGVAPELLNRPNAILAAEYLRALAAQDARMEPCAVRRLGEYHDATLGTYASASAIRKALAAGDLAAAAAVPEAARDFLAEGLAGHGLDDVLLLKLRSMKEADFAALADISEGIERRLYKLCREAADRETLLRGVQGRRYTQARASRLLAAALLDITRELAAAHPQPEYARLLGMRREAAPLLRELNRRARLPIVSDPVRMRGDPVFELERRATDIWALGRERAEERRAGREFTERFVSE